MFKRICLRLQSQLESRQADLERLRQSNSEFEREVAACRAREAELLDFTQKLTEKNVRLQSEFSANESKVIHFFYLINKITQHLFIIIFHVLASRS